MAQRSTASIVHVDLDAFYASVEQLRRPELRGKPVAVGGGVVLAASYEARRFGVRSAMPVGRARKLCPRLIVVSGSFSDYVDCSDRVFAVCQRYTPAVEQISIDEAFLDVAGAVHLFGDPPTIAAAIRADVRSEVGLPISAGVATTKFLAKIASRVAKPDGLVSVEPGGEVAFLHALPVELMWGVGPVTARALADMGVSTIGDLARLPAETLAARLGPGAGRHLHALAWNRDVREVVTSRRAGSVGAQRAFGGDVTDPSFHRTVLRGLADRVGGRLRKNQRAGRTITLRARFADFTAVTRSTTLAAPVATTEALYRIGWYLTDRVMSEAAAGRGLSLLGISVSNLVRSPHLQLELQLDHHDDDVRRAGSAAALAQDRLDAAVDDLRRRFGKAAVGPAAVLLDPRRRMVPDEFGDLAIPVEERRLGRASSQADDAVVAEEGSDVEAHAGPQGWGEAEIGEVEDVHIP
jgi:DNA polymerase-4